MSIPTTAPKSAQLEVETLHTSKPSGVAKPPLPVAETGPVTRKAAAAKSPQAAVGATASLGDLLGPVTRPAAVAKPPQAAVVATKPEWALQVGPKMLKASHRTFGVEICAGSARLTAHLSRVGFDSVGVDWAGNKHRAVGDVVDIDLSTPAGAALLRRVLLHPRLAYVHFAPPCGTATRAREKPIPGEPTGGPRPLRSVQHPRGLPDLEVIAPKAARKVRLANVLYDLFVELARDLTRRRVPWSMENPHASLFWYIR